LAHESGAVADHKFQCSLAFLESYFSSAYALSKRDIYPNYRLLLKTSMPSAAAMIWGYRSLRQVPFIRKWCEGDNWFRPVVMYNGDVGVEEHHCALTCDIIVTGAIALYVISSASSSHSLFAENDAVQDPKDATLGPGITLLTNL
jgi:hypothetical protein